jgi:uncharacterized protein (TIGR03545 family)
MSKWIRWRGLIAFLVVNGLLFTFFLLFVDGLVKRTIEKTGAALVGARVELDDAGLSLIPLGLSLSRLQVTNPDEPMTNAVEISRIAFSMDLLNLLRRKVIIEEMAVDNVRFKTPRKTSGALSRPPEKVPDQAKKSLIEKLSLPSLEIPDVQEILEKEDLQSLTRIRSVRQEIEAEREKWQRRLDELPDKAKLEEYRNRIKDLKSSKKGGLEGLLGGTAGLMALQKEIKGDLDRLNSAKTSLKTDLAGLQKRVNEAARAPLEDVRRLKEKYSLSPQGLSNISRMLLGEQISYWVETGLRWHERLAPVLARVVDQHKEVSVTRPIRGKGMDVHFKEKNPVPDFLIRAAQVSIAIPDGILTGQVNHVTPDQDVMGVPLTFSLSGEKLKDLQRVTLTGEFNRVDPAKPKDQVNLHVVGYQVQDFTLSRSKDFPVALTKGLANFEANAVIIKEALDAKISTGLKSVEISTGLPEQAKPLAKVMAATLADIKGFNFTAQISGTVEDYDVRLTSDLDRVLREAIGKQVREQAERFEARLKSAVLGKVDPELSDLKSRLGGLDGLADELTSRLKTGDGLLKFPLQPG